MKMKLFALALTLMTSIANAASLPDITLTRINGAKEPLSTYAGKILLVVNIATRCGKTPQLDGLEKMSQEYAKQGLVVLGFPSNEFGEQTPEKNDDVEKFCKLNYGVSFPIFEKTTVLGKKPHPLYAYLLKNAKDHTEIEWNFEKFLVSRDGKVLERFASDVVPESTEIVTKLKEALKK